MRFPPRETDDTPGASSAAGTPHRATGRGCHSGRTNPTETMLSSRWYTRNRHRSACRVPASGMDDESGLMHLRFDLPKFLDAQPIDLRFAVLFARRNALRSACRDDPGNLGEKRVARVQLHSCWKAGPSLPSLSRPISPVAISGLSHRRCTALLHRQNQDRSLRPGLQPVRRTSGKVGEADDVVAVIMQAVGQHPVWNANIAACGKHKETIFADRR